MKKLYSATLLLCFLLTFSKPVLADHVMGSEITYKCTSTPGIFEITFVFYRACTGIPICQDSCGAPCTRTLQILGADASCSASNFGSVSLSLFNVRDVQSNLNCSNAKNTCTNMGCKTPGTYTPAVERYEFKGFANIGNTSGIPATCCNVRFVFTECCRNAEINTGATWQNFYVDAIVNRCLSISPCNSSPELPTDPHITVCGGENAILSLGAMDPDFDSLTFAFTPALQSFGSSVTYDPPFSYDKPMPWTGNSNGAFPAGIRCNRETGDIMFTPANTSSAPFYGVVAVEIKQWKTIGGIPQVLGITRRDWEMIVLNNCPPNNPPRFVTNPPEGANPNAPKFKWDFCAGVQNCFTIKAKDTDETPIIDTTYLTWNGAIAHSGATFLPTYNPLNRHRADSLGGPREDSVKFCWTPDDSLVSTLPYYVTIDAKDSRCPNPGRLSRTFSIWVRPNLLKGTIGSIQATDTNACGGIRFKLIDNISDNNVERSLKISRKPNDPNFSQGDYTVINSQNVNHTFQQSGMYYLLYTISQPNNSCNQFSLLDSVLITTPLLINDSFSITHPSCYNGHDAQLHIFASGANMPYTYSINNGLYTSTNVYPGLAKGNYTVNIKDANGCVLTKTATVIDPPKLLRYLAFDSSPQSVFEGEVHYETNIATNEHPGATYVWSIPNGTILSGAGTAKIKVLWTQIGESPITAIMTYDNCIDTINATTIIYPTAGLTKAAPQKNVTFYPNPTNQFIQIDINQVQAETMIQLYDSMGKIVKQQPTKSTQQLDIDLLPAGFYMLKIGEWHGQVIKK